MDNYNDPCTSKTVSTDNGSSPSTNTVPLKEKHDWEIAREGMNLLLNNKFDEAKKLFLSKPDSLPIYAGHAFITFLEAITTFEDEKLSLAFETLRETERRCSAVSTNQNITKTLTQNPVGNSEFNNVAKVLESQIILADCLACIAGLMFFQQDFRGFFRGGWLMRRSWKTYTNAYENISKLYNKTVSAISASANKNNDGSDITSEDSFLSRFLLTEDRVVTSLFPTPSSGYSSSPLFNEKKMSHSQSDTFACQPSNSKCPYNESFDVDQYSSNESINYNKLNVATNNAGNSDKFKFKKRSSFGSKINGFRSSKSHKNFMKKSATTNDNLSEVQHQSGFLTKTLFSPFSFLTSNLSYIASAFGMLSSKTNYDDVIEIQTITRLLCAVSFGYGFFHLATSLLPLSIQRVTSIFGISGDRDKGLEILMFSRLGQDMRSPLATLALLWYYTIVKPYFAFDALSSKKGVKLAARFIAESEEEYRNSAVFLYYKGKVHILKCEIHEAVKSFCICSQNAAQEEIRMLAFHELAWTHMLALEFSEALPLFHFLHLKSRWAMLLYLYLETITRGASGGIISEKDMIYFRSVFENPPAENQMESLLIRRFKHMPKRFTDIGNKTTLYWKSLVYELLYLWNSLPNCTPNILEQITEDCESLNNDPINKSMIGLDKLVSGFCSKIKGETDSAIEKFRSGLIERKGISNDANDSHISAFLNYELGVILIKNEETKAEGKKFLLQTRSIKHYDFEHRVTFRVNALLNRI